MEIVINISEEDYNFVKKQVADGITNPLKICIANGTPLDEKELKLKRWIEKDIKMLNEIIESGWLISDLEKCPAIDACEDAITALKQYPVLDKVMAEIEERKLNSGGEPNRELAFNVCLQIIDKYRGNVDEI